MTSNTLVLSGGGVKGLYGLGALKNIENVKFDEYYGTSIGSILSFLLSISYSPQEIFEICKLNLNSCFDLNIRNVINGKSLCDFRSIKNVLLTASKKKYDMFDESTTLCELYNYNKRKLTIVCSCIDDECAVYLSHESHADMPVLTAIQMSCALPIIFDPVVYNGKTYADGAIFDNVPYEFAKSQTTNKVYTIAYNTKIKNDNYLLDVFYVMMNRLNNLKELRNTPNNDEMIIIEIETEPNMFNLNLQEMEDMFNFGFNFYHTTTLPLSKKVKQA